MPHMLACMIAGACCVRKALRVWVILGPILCFAGLCGWVYIESNSNAKAEGYDMSAPTMREALEEYIDSGKGDMFDIIDGKKHAPVFGKVEMQRYLRTWLGG